MPRNKYGPLHDHLAHLSPSVTHNLMAFVPRDRASLDRGDIRVLVR